MMLILLGDAASLAWVDAYMNNTIPEMESDGWLGGCFWYDTGAIISEHILKEIERAQIPCTSLSQVLPNAIATDPSSQGTQTTDFDTGAPYVMFKGTPYVHLMIPTEGHEYQPSAEPEVIK